MIMMVQQNPGPKNAAGVFDTVNGREMRWEDQRGLVHAVVGADVHEGVRLLWTLCHRDVPADKAFLLKPGMSHEMCVVCMKHRLTELENREATNGAERIASQGRRP